MVKTVFKTGGAKRSTSTFAVECRASEYLFKEGDIGTEMFIIQHGQVEILKSVDGVEKRLAVLEKGDFFGEMAVLEDLPRTASARSLTDSKLLQINGSTFDQMLRSNPEIAVRMMRKLSRRLRKSGSELQAYQERFGGAQEAPEQPLPSMPKLESSQRLVHEDTGIEFFLSSGSESTVGRQDPVTGIEPDVDLTEVDTQRSTSRRHAKIQRRGSRFFLSEEIGTTNGTFVNRVRLDTGVPAEFQVGDEVQFGLVRLAFRDDA